MKKTTTELQEQVRSGKQWNEVLVEGLVVSDIGITVLQKILISDFSRRSRNFRVILRHSCCNHVSEMNITAIQWRIRAKSGICVECARKIAALKQRETKRSAKQELALEHEQEQEQDMGDEWAFGVLNKAVGRMALKTPKYFFP